MKRLLKTVLILTMTCALLTGCTSQEMAKHYGGTTTLDLPADQKLIELTWKDDNMWYLTRPMTDEDVPQTYNFRESSSWGLLEGTVVVVESRSK